MTNIFNTFFYNPIYNGLVFLIDIIPGGDAGVAVILLTILVSLVLFSVSKKAIRTQIKMKEMEPEMKKIKESVSDKQQQALQMMVLYKKYDINPFSVIILVIIQIPVLLALYLVFLKGGLPEINTEILYSFIKVPQVVSMNFIGVLDITQKSLFLAFLAGVTQFIQVKVATPKLEPRKEGQASVKDDFQRSLNTQIKYVLPIIITFISIKVPAALPLYWSTRNIFMTLQELYVKKSIRNK